MNQKGLRTRKVIIKNKSELAGHYGASRTAVANWTRRGLPRLPDGSFDTAEVDRFLTNIGSPRAPSERSLRDRFIAQQLISFNLDCRVGECLLRVLPARILKLRCDDVVEGDPRTTVRQLIQGWLCGIDAKRAAEEAADGLGL